MKAVAIVQARLGSTRLPGKVLMDLAGRPMIDHVLERAQAIKGLCAVALNVPAQDDAQFNFTRNRLQFGIKNQEQDVLGSFLDIAERFNADVIMRLTGDCPLLDPALCYQVLDLYRQLDAFRAYCANDTTRSGWPDGTDCEVFSIASLREAAAKATTPFEREHVTVWMRKACVNYGILSYYDLDLSKRKWSVDTLADLERVRKIYAKLKPGAFGWKDTMKAEDSL